MKRECFRPNLLTRFVRKITFRKLAGTRGLNFELFVDLNVDGLRKVVICATK